MIVPFFLLFKTPNGIDCQPEVQMAMNRSQDDLQIQGNESSGVASFGISASVIWKASERVNLVFANSTSLYNQLYHNLPDYQLLQSSMIANEKGAPLQYLLHPSSCSWNALLGKYHQTGYTFNKIYTV